MIRVRDLIKRSRRSVVAAGALGAVCLSLALAHSGPVGHQMDAGDDEAMASIVSICLGVAAAVAVTAAVVGATFAIRRPRPRCTIPGIGRSPSAQGFAPPVGARAGPAGLQVFRC